MLYLIAGKSNKFGGLRNVPVQPGRGKHDRPCRFMRTGSHAAWAVFVLLLFPAVAVSETLVSEQEKEQWKETILWDAATQLGPKGRLVKDPDSRTGWALVAEAEEKPLNPDKGYLRDYYTYGQVAGRVRATYRLKVADNTISAPVAYIRKYLCNSELLHPAGENIPVRGTDFRAPNKYQDFPVETVKGEKGFFVWAVLTPGITRIWWDGVVVEQVSFFSSEELLPLVNVPNQPPGLKIPETMRVHETYGLFMEMWKVKEAVSLIRGVERTQSYFLAHPQWDRLHLGYPTKWEELYRYRAIVLNNVPAKGVGLVGSLMLKQFIKDGGIVVMMGDTHGLAQGGWQDSELAALLPMALEKYRDVVYSRESLYLKPDSGNFRGLKWSAKPYTVYYHKATLGPEGKVLLYGGDDRIPLIAERRVGAGRLVVILLSVLGEAKVKARGVPFWEWEDWPRLMKNILEGKAQ